MNNNEEKNNVVSPTSVDLSQINISDNDTMLGRERENIVKATIEANDAIDEKKAIKVNDSIKEKKMNPLLRAVIVILLLTLTCAIAYFAIAFVKSVGKDGNEDIPTTTTKRSELAKIQDYINDFSRMRKFQDDNTIILLSPKSFDLVNGLNYYLLINYTEEGIKDTSYGTYSVDEENVKLTATNSPEVSYKITDKGISLNGAILNIMDSEMKYYEYKSKNETKLLIINGTLKSEYAMYIESNLNDTKVITTPYVETMESITLNTGLVFKKVNNKLKYGSSELTLRS